MNRLQLALIALICLLASCQKDEESTVNINGKISITSASDDNLIAALEGVQIYLIQPPIVIDTVTNFFDKSCILSNTSTNSEGEYSFSNLPSNDYIVQPADTIMNYQFEWSSSPDSIWIEKQNTQKEFTINFITKEPVIENDEYVFKFYYSGDYTPNTENVNDPITQVTKIERGYYITSFRTTRVAFGCGWFGTSPCSWYWSDISGFPYDGTITSNSEIFTFKKDASNFVYEFKDEFHFKIYSYTKTFRDYVGDGESSSTEYNWIKTHNISGNSLQKNNTIYISLGE